jgi:CRISPR/Cas system CSM-associated protein Csm3 (group 7 of RAMP superfamily)
MSELQRGTLKVTKKGQRTMVQVLIDSKPFNLAQGELSSNLTPSDGLEVEFLHVGGQPKQVRPVGEPFITPQAVQASQKDHPKRGSRPHENKPSKSASLGRSHNRQAEKDDHETSRQEQRMPDFHNPYNFIPAPPRNTVHPDLGDAPPVPQDSFDPQRYTGRIRVRMVANTPLVVPDTDPANVREDANGHKTFALRVDANGLPAIPSSSVRGMLRSAFEAITNSRFGRFSISHKTKLMYREAQQPFRKVAFPKSPWELLHPSLRLPASINELSPADRVFGWVRTDADQDQSTRDNERVAARGQLRVGPVTCESSVTDAVESFRPPGVPLAILSTPKPQQGRFYVAKSPNGEAQDDGLSKIDAGYSNGKGLRGRKVYPHQKRLTAEHWNNPTKDRTQTRDASGYYQEYRRPTDQSGREQRDDQNRSILGWIKPGAVFTFDIHVQNLSQVELGALLWLLTLPDEHYFRLGGGKPLGFGSVRLTIEECDLRTGDQLRSRYSAWNTEVPTSDPSEAAIRSFKEAILDAYSPNQGNNFFDDIPFIKAFLVACKGFGDELPAHYPRATEDGQPGPPSPDGESFKWFVANEKNGARYALRDLTQEEGLPTLQDSQQRRDGRGQRRP